MPRAPKYSPICGIVALAFLWQKPVLAQATYFQQEVNYHIRVTLDDIQHTLRGQMRLEYINHSPASLAEIWLHLWPNAYRSRQTAFCRQKLRQGDMHFYFAPDSSMGYLSGVDFRVNGQPVRWEFHPKHPDIARLWLNEPLPPGGRIVLETPFEVKIPAVFSRLGHTGQSYQISQWYPKPAVYDTRGWHPMPYLDMGEFYAEFGTFEVEITLPENYVVGATGVLQSPEEQAFLLRRMAETQAELERLDVEGDGPKPFRKAPNDTFPPSSPVLKTLRFRAERVHDFAWFADKRFRVLREVALLESGREVECWAMFLPSSSRLWRQAATYVRRAVEFYSAHVGEYPWPQATAVLGALSAGGGMEYPMVTVISDAASEESLDEIIAHEVGHNWFYGVLASNERAYPWLDEGLNSYYEQRYMEHYYGQQNARSSKSRNAADPKNFGSLSRLLSVALVRVGDTQTPATPVEALTRTGYFATAYVKPPLYLQWLEKASGRLLFDRAMKHYFQRWQFRHPYPEDLQAAWREAGLEADWFFEAMQSAAPFDMAVRRVRRLPSGEWEVRVSRRKGQKAPFSISALRNDQVVHTQWYAPVEGSSAVLTFPAVSAEAFVLDYEGVTLDAFHSNNGWRVGRLLPKRRPLHVWPLALFEATDRTVVGLLPWVGWNQYDKATIGLALHSPLLPPQRLRYYLLPGIGTASGNVVGLVDVQYRFLPGGLIPHATAGFSVRSATYAHRLGEVGYRLQYWRWSPTLRLDLRSGSPSFVHALDVRAILLQKEEPIFSDQGVFAGKSRPTAQVYEVRYEAHNLSAPNPCSFFIGLEGQHYSVQGAPASYLRAAFEWQQEFYYKPKKRLYVRLFGGYFLHNTQRYRGSVATNSLTNDVARASFALNPQGFNDYRFDQVFLGRTDTRGFLARQVSQTEGGFKNAFGPAYAQVFGNSNDFIAALNLRADLPFRMPFKPYFDLGYFRDATPLGASRSLQEQLVWSGGLMLEVLRGHLEVYFPLVHSSALSQLYTSATSNYAQHITWSIRLPHLRARDREQLFQWLN